MMFWLSVNARVCVQTGVGGMIQTLRMIRATKHTMTRHMAGTTMTWMHTEEESLITTNNILTGTHNRHDCLHPLAPHFPNRLFLFQGVERGTTIRGGTIPVTTTASMTTTAAVNSILTTLTELRCTASSQHTVCIHHTVDAVASVHAHSRCVLDYCVCVCV